MSLWYKQNIFPVQCKDCDTFLGNLFGLDNASYQFLPYALPPNIRTLPDKRIQGDVVYCHECLGETILTYPK